jgi:hypothetical protein
LSSFRLIIESKDDKDGEDSLSLILYRSYFMILKYSSSDFVETRRVKA